ncbi:MAG TPA: amino acid permease [Streptosporangiaceae bacterium]|nr:amino acid permease [Streptosporangiaceae bacterium]
MAKSQDAAEEATLEQFGYRQQFDRTFRLFASFAIGFSFISITTGIFTTYGSVLLTSGPLGIWTWPLVIVGQLAVALVFAVLASRIPLAGYSYQWMSRLANPYIGWLVGWFTFAFLVVDVVAVDYAVASTVVPTLFSYTGTSGNTWLVTALIVIVQGLLIMFSTLWTRRVNNAAVTTEIAGVGGLTVLLLIVGAVRGLLNWGHLFSRAAVPAAGYFGFGGGTHDSPWMFAFLLGAFTIVGFEACGNLAEETQEPGIVVPRAMWSSVVISGVIGFAFLIAITASTGNLKVLTASSTPVADVVIRVLGSVIGKIFLVIVLYSIFACGLVIFVTATRVSWAMARDERFPGWQALRRVNPRFDSPAIATVTVGIVIEIVLAVFATRTNALFKLFSAATLMPALIYLVTTVLYVFTRRRLPSTHGFRLGRWELPVMVIALVWLVFEMSIFRDSSFGVPWLYVAVMMGVGVIYFVYLLITRHSLAMSSRTQAFGPGDELSGPEPPGQPGPGQPPAAPANGGSVP